MATATNKMVVAETIGEAQLRAHSKAKYLLTQLMTLIPCPTPGLPYLAAVDEGWRMYYQPEMLSKHPINEAGGVVMHELMHVLFRHFERTRMLLGGREATREERMRANIAGDLAINPIVIEMGLSLPKGGCFPAEMGLKVGLSMEEYYSLVPQKEIDKQLAYQDAMEKLGQAIADAISESPGCDGQGRPWMLDPKHPTCPAKTKIEAEMLERDAAKSGKQAGNIPGGLRRWCDSVLDSTVTWQKELRASIAVAVTSSHGCGDYNWKRPSRRAPPKVLLPSTRQPQPNVAAWIDTSGSMGKEDLTEAVSEAAAILRSTKCGLKVYAGDTDANCVKHVYKHDSIELIGGGGTDGARILEQISADRPKNHVIVAITDGFTGWPAKQLPQKVIACITSHGTRENIPSWIKVVQVGGKKGRGE